MTIRLNLRSGIVLVAVLVVIGAGIAYAAARISREVTGAFVVGNVQTTDETILLYSQLEPLTALEEILIPTEDVDAFGFFVNRPRVPFWVANGGGVGFELTVMGVAVEVIRGNEVIAAGEDILSLVMGPAGEELRPYPDNGVRDSQR